MRKEKMGFTVGQFRMLCLSTALAAFGVLGQQALADGDTGKPLAPPLAVRATTSGSVSVDMSALDSVPNRRLLLPGVAAPAVDGPVRLRPPPGVKPIVQAPIRLRPPPGVQIATSAPAAPKAPETKMAAVTPAPAPPAPAPKAEPPRAEPPRAQPPKTAPPAAAAPAKTAAAPPAPAAKAPASTTAPQPKAAAATPAPAALPPQKQTQVAVATPPPAAPSNPAPGQPRSLLTPPPAPASAPPASAPPVTTASAAPAPAKTEEAKPAEPPKETNVAVVVPPTRTPGEPESLTISFKVGGADVPADSTAALKTLAAKLAKDPTTRLQLIAYASDPEKSISRSRRLSLERAVNVRKVMLAAGIESTRIDIRALGEQSGSGAADRVDAITVKR